MGASLAYPTSVTWLAILAPHNHRVDVVHFTTSRFDHLTIFELKRKGHDERLYTIEHRDAVFASAYAK